MHTHVFLTAGTYLDIHEHIYHTYKKHMGKSRKLLISYMRKQNKSFPLFWSAMNSTVCKEIQMVNVAITIKYYIYLVEERNECE